MRSLEWVLIQSGVLKGREESQNRHVQQREDSRPTGRRPRDHWVRECSDPPTSRGTPRVAICHQQLEEARKFSSLNSSVREQGLAGTLILNFKPPEPWEKTSLLLSGTRGACPHGPACDRQTLGTDSCLSITSKNNPRNVSSPCILVVIISVWWNPIMDSFDLDSTFQK